MARPSQAPALIQRAEKALSKRTTGTAEQATGSDPGTHQRADQKCRRDSATRNHEIVLRFDLPTLGDADADEKQQIDSYRPDIDQVFTSQ